MEHAIAIINHQIVELEKLQQNSPSLLFNKAQKELKKVLEIIEKEKNKVFIKDVKIKGFTPIFGNIECCINEIKVDYNILNNSINNKKTN